MKTTSEYPSSPSPKAVLVWDAPVRIFHWLMALSFAGAYLTAETERWRLVHISLGYTMGGLVIFRMVWGILGTRYARFTNFVRGPQKIARYLKSLSQGQPQHFIGHNPAGSLAIVGLLGLSLLVAVSGCSVYNDIGGEWLAGLHEGAANTMLILVGIHISGVILASWMHHENLIHAMFSGRKSGKPSDGIDSPRWLTGVLLLAGVLGFWYLQWHGAI